MRTALAVQEQTPATGTSQPRKQTRVAHFLAYLTIADAPLRTHVKDEEKKHLTRPQSENT
jgi:hypothetical protein